MMILDSGLLFWATLYMSREKHETSLLYTRIRHVMLSVTHDTKCNW